jgi:hypothetical protein
MNWAYLQFLSFQSFAALPTHQMTYCTPPFAGDLLWLIVHFPPGRAILKMLFPFNIACRRTLDPGPKSSPCIFIPVYDNCRRVPIKSLSCFAGRFTDGKWRNLWDFLGAGPFVPIHPSDPLASDIAVIRPNPRKLKFYNSLKISVQTKGISTFGHSFTGRFLFVPNHTLFDLSSHSWSV